MKKVILITGASAGMGKATALHLIHQGHTVYGAARRVEKMADMEEAGGHAISMDITKQEDINKAVSEVLDREKHIDVLINNAGYAIYGAVEDTSIEDARRQFEVNIFGLAAITKAVLPHMRERKSGTVINISSMGGKIYTPLGAWYHATKHALEGWSDCLRLELKQFNIDVVIVEPGIINTEFGDVMTAPMLERSGKGAYAEMTHKIGDAVKESYADGAGSSPDVIAKTIAKAINSKKPKTRYVGGKLAKPMIFLRGLLSDRLFDKAVMSQVK